MKRKFGLIILLISTPFFTGCNQAELEEKKEEVARLKKEKQALKVKSEKKDVLVDAFFETFNKVERDLNRVTKEEDTVLFEAKKDVELIGNRKDRMVGKIEKIDELMKKNRQRVEDLNARLEESGLEVVRLKESVGRLKRLVQKKNEEIIALEDELATKDIILQELYGEYQKRLEEMDEQQKKLNTGFFAVGTFKELEEKNVLTKEGGFIGLGRVEKLKDDPNKEYFTRVNIQEKDKIEIFGKKPEIVTNHSEGSYTWEGEDPIEYLKIEDSKKFWETSKYLVIVVK